MLNRRIYFCLSILVTTICSCASYSKRQFKKDLQPLKTQNLLDLNGSYSYHPVSRYFSFRKQSEEDKTPDSLVRNNSYSFILDNYDSNNFKDRHITLYLKTEKELIVELVEDSIVLEETLITGKLKNGMFYLDNKFLDCNGIPYFFGGCKNRKRRIGLKNNGNLLINEAEDTSGAILFFISGGVAGYNSTFEYLRK